MTKYKPCPKCKSKEGYSYKILTPYNQWVDLNGEPITADDSSGGYEYKTFECIECNSRFREKTILNK
jgi:hypothetical protein